jgi:two-component sensor histidine kinase
MKKLSPLAVKQFLWVLLVGALLTVVAVYLQFSAQYREELGALDSRFDSVEHSYLPPLALSVFNFDVEQTRLLAQGIALLPDVAYVEVRERRGDDSLVLVALGEKVEGEMVDRSYPLTFQHDGRLRHLGTLMVQADVEGIRRRISERLPIMVASSAGQVFAVAFLVLVIVQVSIVRHLKKTARFVHRIDPRPVDAGTLSLEHLSGKLHVPDEIDEIVQSINAMNARLKDAFSQKDILLRELYHRTKNNMQVIASMLSVQAARVPENDQLQRLVTDTQNRIYAMSLVHEKLYQSNDLSRIEIRDYLSQLALHISASYSDGAGPRIDLRLEPREVLLDVAIPCGLIVNELVANALKYAFPEERPEGAEAVVAVGFEVDANAAARLSVSDNGVGLPEGLDPRTDGSMGLQSVVALAEHQLGGSIRFVGPPGSACVVEFSLSQYSERV